MVKLMMVKQNPIIQQSENTNPALVYTWIFYYKGVASKYCAVYLLCRHGQSVENLIKSCESVEVERKEHHNLQFTDLFEIRSTFYHFNLK